LALNNFGIQGNFGTQDQLLALNWVKSNIKAFGGDPVSVLVDLRARLTSYSQKLSCLDSLLVPLTAMSLAHCLKLLPSYKEVSLSLAVVDGYLRARLKMPLVRDTQPA